MDIKFVGIKKVRSIIDYVSPLVVGLILGTIISMVFQLTLVSGKSMYPTLDNKDYLFINKLAYRGLNSSKLPNRGDIIVFDNKLIDDTTKSSKKLIKRVIGLPGDRIEIVNGFVYLNDERLVEPYLDGVFTDGEVDMVVPENSIYVLGDNRPHSGDSRLEEIGAVSMDTVIGEAVFRLFPFNKLGKIDGV